MKKPLLIIFLLCLLSCQSTDRSVPSIEPLKNFALNYNPCLEGDDCDAFFLLPDVPQAVENVLVNREVDNELIIYNTLIILKMYRAQLERTHQSYDIRGGLSYSQRNPILRAFSSYSGVRVSGDFVSSDIAYHWAKKQVSINTNPQIKRELEKTDKIHSDIDKGLFWKQ